MRSRSPARTDNFRDGWVVEYHSNPVEVRVEYLDWQFNVIFKHQTTRVSFLIVDRELHAQRSGLYGDMFPPDKLAGAIEQVAVDIRDHYSDVLTGEAATWAKLKRLSEAPATKGKLP